LANNRRDGAVAISDSADERSVERFSPNVLIFRKRKERIIKSLALLRARFSSRFSFLATKRKFDVVLMVDPVVFPDRGRSGNYQARPSRLHTQRTRLLFAFRIRRRDLPLVTNLPLSTMTIIISIV